MNAIIYYNKKDYKQATYYFDQCLRAGDFAVYEGAKDTVMYYNAALAAHNAEMYDEAKRFYKESINLEYGGKDTYINLRSIYLEQGDTTAAIESLKEGLNKLKDSDLARELANLYIITNRAEEALKYINIILETDDSNDVIWFTKGVLVDRVGDKETALACYKKAIELNPQYFDAYYNLSVIHYNQAVEIFDQGKRNQRQCKI
ncbi:MAG: tetratricopeptide repeat protein [Bacteroidales bacterium]|nr:tetratricopeptide repeat protein [Bacteroidales bacterium]